MLHRVGSISAWLLVALSAVAQAQPLRFSFADPAGDNPPGIPDAVRLVFTFDSATGDYEIVVTADAASPFAPTPSAMLGLRINIFNADVGVTTPDPSFFNFYPDFQLNAPTTSLVLTGTNSRLLQWEAGDRVAIDSSLGNPDGTGQFGSLVRVFQDRTIIGDDQISPGGTATIAPVPEPSSCLLLVASLSLAPIRYRKSKIPVVAG